MISRLVLVGMVAVLGVTLPSRPEGEGWFTSAREWMIAQLAEWDTYNSREGDGCFVVEPPDFSGRDVSQVATHTAASATFEPIPVDQNLEWGIADELNRMSEGLYIPPKATMIAESHTDFTPAPSSDSIEMKLAVELCRFAEGWEADETLASRTADQPRETETVDAINGIFEMDMAVFGPSAKGLASNTQAESFPNAAQSNLELIEPLADCKLGFAEESNRLAEGIEVRLEDVGIRPARIRTFEPIELPADLGSDMAYELNRASEDLGIIPPEVRELGETRPRSQGNERAAHSEAKMNEDPSIGKAARLTRDAALAWVNLLTGPTSVEMTSR